MITIPLEKETNNRCFPKRVQLNVNNRYPGYVH